MKEEQFPAGDAFAVDRRAEGRTTAVYRPVLIETDEFGGFCLVKNLSPGGMMGVAYAQFAADQPVTIQFHPEHVVSGVIVWSQGDRIGARFDEPIDVEAVLHNLASKHVGTLINRAPRLPIECGGEVEIDGRRLPIKLIDISQRGAKVAAGFVKPGETVVLRLEGLDPHRAEVRWTQTGLAGLHFLRPIAFEDLARWVIERQSG
jgi:hypothetical protein